jgi:hypothetical protein
MSEVEDNSVERPGSKSQATRFRVRIIIFSLIVAGAVLSVVVSIGIQHHNDRLLSAQLIQSEVELQTTGAKIADIKDHKFKTTRLIFFKDWFVDGHIAGTRSPANPSGASDLGASLTYRSNWLDGVVERRKTGPNFNPEVGFIQRVDSNETYGDLTFKVRPKIGGIRELQFEGFILHAPDIHEEVSTQEWQNTSRADFNKAWLRDLPISAT